jgi:hypothetical protein
MAAERFIAFVQPRKTNPFMVSSACDAREPKASLRRGPTSVDHCLPRRGLI